VAFGTDDGKEAIIYVHDLSGGTSMRRLTRDGNNRYPAWTHDGRRIAFQSDRRGAPAVFWQLADGTGPADALTTPADGEAHAPESWSPNGDRLLFSVRKGSSVSLWEYSVSDRKAFPFAAQFGGVQSSFPTGAVFSPDGGWVAYVVSERNRPKIFVRPYPPTEAKYELPMAQAPHEVTWSNDGTELFFNPLLLQFASVSVTTKPAFTFGKYVPIRKEFMLGPPSAWRNYDVSRDGRFLGVFAPSQDGTVAATREIRVVLNWFEELKRLVPVN
jgi:Tol biopolymer transport system component